MDENKFTVKEGDVFTGFCCEGYDWEVRLIFPDTTHPGDSEVWGRCSNPDCANYQPGYGPDDPWRGVGRISVDDLEEWYEQAAQQP